MVVGVYVGATFPQVATVLLPSSTHLKAAIVGIFLVVIAEIAVIGQRDAKADQPEADSNVVVTAPADVLANYCITCHGADAQKAGVRFDSLELIDPVALQKLLARAQKAVHLG